MYNSTQISNDDAEGEWLLGSLANRRVLPTGGLLNACAAAPYMMTAETNPGTESRGRRRLYIWIFRFACLHSHGVRNRMPVKRGKLH